jgi:hypothetical protein
MEISEDWESGRVYLDVKEMRLGLANEFTDKTFALPSSTFTHNPDDVEANLCAIGRAATGHSFEGQIDYLQVYSIAKA